MSKWMTMLCKDEKGEKAANAKSPSRIVLDSPSLNWALGGGLLEGHTTAFYGPEQSGKSLLSMVAAAAIHKRYEDGIVVLVSSEMRTPPPERLIPLGVDPERLFVRKVNTIHDIFDWIACADSKFKNSDGTDGPPGLLYMLRDGAPIRGLMIDSIKAIQGPKEMASESAEDTIMGDLSRYLNPALKKILPVIRDHALTTVLVQQVNMNMNPDEVKYQNKKWTIPSGQALKHFCETMVLVERMTNKDSKLFDADLSGIRELPLQMGHSIRCTVDKANLDRPFRDAEFRIHYNKGLVDKGLEVFKLAKSMNVIVHPKNEKGADINTQWVFTSGDVAKKWIGAENCINDLEENIDLRLLVMSEVYKRG
jgi:RecA/RadA recombinase